MALAALEEVLNCVSGRQEEVRITEGTLGASDEA